MEITKELEALVGGPVREEIRSENIFGDTTRLYFDAANTCVAGFALGKLPASDRYCVFSNVWTRTEFRGRGIGKKLLAYREELARDCGYRTALATVNESNEVEIHILEAAGWTRIHTFTSVGLWAKDLV